MYVDEMAPAVQSILEAARDRPTPGGRVSVSPHSLPEALGQAEAAGRQPVIAEIKPTSPTTDGRRDDDPIDLAGEMVAAGAAALSVLTEPTHFGGSPEALSAIRDAVDVPVLRKDFLVEPTELDRVEADVILLIARFLDDLPEMIEAARDRGFQVLVEVHTPDELATAQAAGAGLIGINNRDLAKLSVDRSTFERVARDAGDDVTLIAESGIETPDHVRRMRAVGADGLLIGSAIMDGDVSDNTRRFVNA
jgi:indole-3-glycerol phosphate synthase